MVVEIPRGSRNKYEIDHETGEIWLDRRLFSATVYPADYGFIDHTLGEDGDPLDAMVIMEEPTFPGCRVRARPVGVFWMEDDAGPDAKNQMAAANNPESPQESAAADDGMMAPPEREKEGQQQQPAARGPGDLR